MASVKAKNSKTGEELEYRLIQYTGEEHVDEIMSAMEADLSEPYNIFTYRYFLNRWPELTFLAMIPDDKDKSKEKCIGAIVCSIEDTKNGRRRGYIAMLAVTKEYRHYKIGSTLVKKAIDEMKDADEIALETETNNAAALGFYGKLGFIRSKKMFKYYLSGTDAYQLILPITPF